MHKLFLVSEYFHMYQRSTSFDVGVFTDDFSLGLSYHKDVEEVYKSITATGQAVGKLICYNNLRSRLFFKQNVFKINRKGCKNV